MITKDQIKEEFTGWYDGCYCGWDNLYGWNEIIWNLCHELKQILEKNNTPLSSFVVAQVKEKFGGLRFYYDLDAPRNSELAEEIFDAVNAAEKKSYKVCLNCGEPGVRRDTRWITTLCDKHFKEIEERLRQTSVITVVYTCQIGRYILVEENSLPHIDECRYLILKVVEQSVRDYLALEDSRAPIEKYYFEIARDFIFNDDYVIHWGKSTKSCTDLLDILDIDIDWFRDRVRRVKEKKMKEFEIKRMLKHEY